MIKNLYNATKDYICEHCRRVIPEGEKYADYSYNSKQSDGTLSWHHYRYHIDCDIAKKPVPEPPKDKRAFWERIQDRLNKEGAFPAADNDNIKLWVCGLFYEEDGPRYVLCREWCSRQTFFVSIESAKKFTDCEGNYL